MRAPVTVVTATIPGREGSHLPRCLASVYAQTVEVEAHLVMAQSCTEGLPGPVHCSIQQNWLLSSVSTEWTMRLADDDALLPHHVETLLPHLDRGEVVYSFDAARDRPRVDVTDWPQDQLVTYLASGNFLDASAVFIRTDVLREINGWPVDYERGRFAGTPATAEDWAAFYLLAEIGARFVCIPQETWRYGGGDWPRISNGH